MVQHIIGRVDQQRVIEEGHDLDGMGQGLTVQDIHVAEVEVAGVQA